MTLCKSMYHNTTDSITMFYNVQMQTTVNIWTYIGITTTANMWYRWDFNGMSTFISSQKYTAKHDKTSFRSRPVSSVVISVLKLRVWNKSIMCFSTSRRLILPSSLAAEHPARHDKPYSINNQNVTILIRYRNEWKWLYWSSKLERCTKALCPFHLVHEGCNSGCWLVPRPKF